MSTITKKKIAITNAQAEEIIKGIGAIDGGYRVTVDGKDCQRGFRLDAKTRTALVMIGIALKPIVEGYDKNRKQIFEDNHPKISIDKDDQEVRHIPSENVAIYNAEIRTLDETSQEIELPTIRLKDLNLGEEKNQNAIPSLAIALISPILAPESDEG
jgi:hypothetical protein